MRTRGIDGRCITCVQPIAHRCSRCHRVRYEVGGDWQDHPGMLPREVEAMCRTCGEAKRLEQVARLEGECRRTRLRAATGKLTTVLPADPFQGFRGEK
jgi:hypothetical protein